MSDYQYKFIPASLRAGAQKGGVPKSDYVSLFQHTMDEQFYNASNWYTIEEETTVGSAKYSNVDVRIAHVINAETGLKLGDDWKTLLFQNVEHPIELGKLYKMNDSTWLTTNTEFIKNLTGTCTIRRCNNTLRWIDEPTGIYYTEPCCIEYLVKEPRNYATQGSPFITPGGFLHIETQLNSRSGKIKENQRFLFGNPQHWTCYKVVGTGINDFRNVATYDNMSAKILTLDLVADFVSPELDDMVNGIADVYTNVYVVTLSQESIEGMPGETIQMQVGLTYNKDTATRNILWSSSDSSVASVTSAGLVTLNSIGNCTITATVEGNPAHDTCNVAVSNTPVNITEIRLTPNTNYVLEGSTRDYTVYLYNNNIQQADTFTITCAGNSVPSANYVFAQTGANAFRISNLRRDDLSYLTVSCTSASALYTKSYDIRLLGAWQHDNI